MYKRQISFELSKRINEPRRMIQVLAGPRQVGKTFAVKQALENCKGGFTYRLAEGLMSYSRPTSFRDLTSRSIT